MHKLLKMRSLAVISHTEHYYTTDGKVVGWEPTVRELNYLAELFDLIYHIAPIHDNKPNRATAAYKADNIIYVPIKPSGGKTTSAFKLFLSPLVPTYIIFALRRSSDEE